MCAFSTTMIAASTIAPIATAIPPSDMMFAFRPWYSIGTNASATPIGITRIGISALRTCRRNTRITIETTIISSTSVSRSVAIASRIRSERS